MQITREQIKAGRALLGIDQRNLADRAGVSLVTLRRLEGHAEYDNRVAAPSVQKVIAALEDMGVCFLFEGDVAGGGGVALKPGVPTRVLRASETDPG
jgi:transcriptional regulator with XRE-family HTH domain